MGSLVEMAAGQPLGHSCTWISTRHAQILWTGHAVADDMK